MNRDILKKQVGAEAVKEIKSGMVVGLGSGTTVHHMVDFLGKRVLGEHLKIECVTTSQKTASQAISLGIKMQSIDEVGHIDLTIDGADEVDKNLNGIKGGGAALLWEKIVAKNSAQNIWIVDEGKIVNQLGKFPLPVEVIKFGSHQLFKKFENLGYLPEFRQNKAGSYVLTDSGNYIIDLHLGKINETEILSNDIKSITGVVEHGLFLDIANEVIVGTDHGITRIKKAHD